jgi:hypothetical protein
MLLERKMETGRQDLAVGACAAIISLPSDYTCDQYKNVNSAVKFICKIPGSGAGCIGQEKPKLLPLNHLPACSE